MTSGNVLAFLGPSYAKVWAECYFEGDEIRRTIRVVSDGWSVDVPMPEAAEKVAKALLNPPGKARTWKSMPGWRVHKTGPNTVVLRMQKLYVAMTVKQSRGLAHEIYDWPDDEGDDRWRACRTSRMSPSAAP